MRIIITVRKRDPPHCVEAVFERAKRKMTKEKSKLVYILIVHRKYCSWEKIIPIVRKEKMLKLFYSASLAF